MIRAIRAIRKERIQRASWVDCLNMARVFKLVNEPPMGHIYGLLEFLIQQEIALPDANRRRRHRKFRLHQRWQTGVPMEVDDWEEKTSSGVGDTASTTDESERSDAVSMEQGDDADVVVEGEVGGPDEDVSDVEVVIEDDEWDDEEDRLYEPLTPPPADMWALDERMKSAVDTVMCQ